MSQLATEDSSASVVSQCLRTLDGISTSLDLFHEVLRWLLLLLLCWQTIGACLSRRAWWWGHHVAGHCSSGRTSSSEEGAASDTNTGGHACYPGSSCMCCSASFGCGAGPAARVWVCTIGAPSVRGPCATSSPLSTVLSAVHSTFGRLGQMCLLAGMAQVWAQHPQQQRQLQTRTYSTRSAGCDLVHVYSNVITDR